MKKNIIKLITDYKLNENFIPTNLKQFNNKTILFIYLVLCALNNELNRTIKMHLVNKQN